MPQAGLSFTVSILVPVMLLIVVEISSIAREITLTEQIPRNRRPYQSRSEKVFLWLLSKLPGIDDSRPQVPQLGHFGSLHGINCVILLYGLMLVNHSLEGSGEYFLGLAVVIVLVMLPYIEIDEYTEIRGNGVNPFSIKIHAASAVWGGGVATVLGDLFTGQIHPVYPVLLGALFLLIPFVSIQIYFSERLVTELEEGVIPFES